MLLHPITIGFTQLNKDTEIQLQENSIVLIEQFNINKLIRYYNPTNIYMRLKLLNNGNIEPSFAFECSYIGTDTSVVYFFLNSCGSIHSKSFVNIQTSQWVIETDSSSDLTFEVNRSKIIIYATYNLESISNIFKINSIDHNTTIVDISDDNKSNCLKAKEHFKKKRETLSSWSLIHS